MIKAIIDSDIIMDFFFERKPFDWEAELILAYCELGDIKGYVTPVIVSNLYYFLRKLKKHEQVIADLKQLLRILEVAEINKSTIMEALSSKFSDFEDALHNYSIIPNCEIKVIITRNEKDYKWSNYSILTPKLYLKTFHNLDYTSNTTSS